MRFKVIVLVSSLFIGVESDSKQKAQCTTLDGHAGECTSLHHCPVLLPVLANPKKEMIIEFNKFLCPKEEEIHTFYSSNDSVVCCTDGKSEVYDKYLSTTVINGTGLADVRYCGIQATNDRYSVQEGIQIDEFPWIAQIIVPDAFKSCVGTLINAKYVLTNTWCAQNAIVVRLGEFHVKNQTDYVELSYTKQYSDYVDYSIEEKILHPYFHYYTKLNDIALLKLNITVEFSDTIRPICLPIPTLTSAKPGDVVYSSGWGEVGQSFNKVVDLEMKITATLITNTECIRSMEEDRSMEIISDYKLCIKESEAEASADDICLYNSGAPVMVRGSRYQWHIEGLFSKHFVRCGPNKVQTYTRVSKYLQWIQDNMRF